MSLPDDFFKQVHGFISLPEAELLNRLASEVPSGGNIVEIGAYQGRSTIALALGAKEAEAIVYSIDHHPTYDIDGVHFSMADNQVYYENIVKYQVGDVVRTVNFPSYDVSKIWLGGIDLLFIDGSHDFDDVQIDWLAWSPFARVIAMHDTVLNYHPGVTRVVEEILKDGKWARTEIVDSMSVFRRVK